MPESRSPLLQHGSRVQGLARRGARETLSDSESMADMQFVAIANTLLRKAGTAS